MCGCNKRQPAARVPVAPRRVQNTRVRAVAPSPAPNQTQMNMTPQQSNATPSSRDRREIERKRRIAVRNALGR